MKKKPYECPRCGLITSDAEIVSAAASINGAKARHVMTAEHQAKCQAGRKAVKYRRRAGRVNK